MGNLVVWFQRMMFILAKFQISLSLSNIRITTRTFIKQTKTHEHIYRCFPWGQAHLSNHKTHTIADHFKCKDMQAHRERCNVMQKLKCSCGHSYASLEYLHRCFPGDRLIFPGINPWWKHSPHLSPLQYFLWDIQKTWSMPVLFNRFFYGAPWKIFWRTHAPYLPKHLKSCTLFTDISPVPPT